MTDFQPLGCGLGRPNLPPASPADDTPPSEPDTMAKKSASIGDTILRAIAEAGGTISGSDLRDAMPDIADANRRYHLQQLCKAGRVTATGSTSNREYHLADGETASQPAERIPNKAKPAKAAKRAKAPKATKATKQRRLPYERVLDPATGLRVSRAVDLKADELPIAEQVATGIAPHFLRRVLLLALNAPGDIANTDRQALAAVAAAAS